MTEERHTFTSVTGDKVTYNEPSMDALRAIIQGLIKFGVL